MFKSYLSTLLFFFMAGIVNVILRPSECQIFPFFVFAYFKLLEEFIGCALGSKSKTAYDRVLNIIQSNLTST